MIKLLRFPYALYSSIKQSYNLVVNKGLFITALRWNSQDKDGNPIPWFSYPAIDYLNSINLSTKRVFEWGSGNSTLFFQGKAKSIMSVEDDPIWHGKIVNECPNVKLTTDKESYINAIKGKYDIIVIDGSYREECAVKAFGHLRKGGFIIADNTDTRPELKNILNKSRLLRIPFIGPYPIGGTFELETTFYFS